MYLARIAALEEQLSKLDMKYQNLRTRRNLEVEGYKTDMYQIHKKIRIYDEYLHRVKRLIREDPKRAIELAKNNELDVEPIREKLQDMEAKLDNNIHADYSGDQMIHEEVKKIPYNNIENDEEENEEEENNAEGNIEYNNEANDQEEIGRAHV